MSQKAAPPRSQPARLSRLPPAAWTGLDPYQTARLAFLAALDTLEEALPPRKRPDRVRPSDVQLSEAVLKAAEVYFRLSPMFEEIAYPWLRDLARQLIGAESRSGAVD